ncbi:hypothetical protein KKA15_05065 [Patescibacteria group bacterium]|nr:hypothetical protein [Patescibacteria group bacterium]
MKSIIFPKVKEWFLRYILAEIVAIIGAMVGGLLAYYFFNNLVATALGGTWGENIGYYGQIIYSDLKKSKQKDGKITFIIVLKLIRNAIIEFGPGEYLDSFLIRPITMYFFISVVGSLPVGLFLGKISADVIFYIPTITAYEFQKKYIKD